MTQGSAGKKVRRGSERRKLAKELVTAGTTILRACRVLYLDPKVYRYRSKRSLGNNMIESLLKQYAGHHPDYGFKKLFALIRQQGHVFNHKRVHRIYVELKLNLKRQPKKRLAPKTSEVLAQPSKPNQCGSLDYMNDALTSGRWFRTVNVIDDYHREALGIEVSFSLPAKRVIRCLDNLAQFYGCPEAIRVDNGPENRARCFQEWAKKQGIEIKYIQPGKPAQNAYIERFNRSYQQAILDQYLFKNLTQVQ